MTTTQTKPLCSRCGNSESAISMDCRKCHHSAIVMIYVHKCYRADELESFRDQMRERSISDLISRCPQGAWVTRRIFLTIRVLAHPAKMHEDELKRAVCDEISRYIGSMKAIAKYEAENGEGSYMRAWINALPMALNPKK